MTEIDILFRRGIRDPRGSIAWLIGGSKKFNELERQRAPKRLAKYLGVSSDEINNLIHEARESHFSVLLSEMATRYVLLGALNDPEYLYAICRILRPRVVVETGVANGVSSGFILQALIRNGSGHLFSIDLPNHDVALIRSGVKGYRMDNRLEGDSLLPRGKSPGWLVPDDFRSLWTLKLGLSSELLPDLVRQEDPIDIFLHDSEHTYRNMMFEFKTVWPHLKSGGLLVSDNVNWENNRAFYDFARSVKTAPCYLPNAKALLRKK